MLFLPFGKVKTALALAPEGLDPQNVKLGKGKHPCFFSFLVVSVLFLYAFVSFTRVFDTFLHLLKLWITPVSVPAGPLKLNIFHRRDEPRPDMCPAALGHSHSHARFTRPARTGFRSTYRAAAGACRRSIGHDSNRPCHLPAGRQVGVVKECGQAAVAALRDMVRKIGHDYASDSSHAWIVSHAPKASRKN